MVTSEENLSPQLHISLEDKTHFPNWMLMFSLILNKHVLQLLKHRQYEGRMAPTKAKCAKRLWSHEKTLTLIVCLLNCEKHVFTWT